MTNILIRSILVISIVSAITPTAHSAVVFTASETGGNVVVSGSGSLDVDSWGVSAGGFFTSNLIPDMAGVIMGTSGVDVGTGYGTPSNYSAPANFGTGSDADASSGSGDAFGITDTAILFVPNGYSSGDPLAGTMTFAGQSFASLGMDLGSYTWSWGTGGDADSITLNVIPEPSAALLFGLGLAAVSLRRRR